MRITVDRETVHLALTGQGGAETRELAEGISAVYDAAGRLVGVTIREVGRLSGAPDAVAVLTVDLGGAAETVATAEPSRARSAAGSAAPPSPPVAQRPAAAPYQPAPLTPAERAALGPLTWDA